MLMKKFFSVLLILLSFPVFAAKAADEAFRIVENESPKVIKKAILKNSSFYSYTRGRERENLLMAALKNDREYDVIKLLLDAGISPTSKTRSKVTALMYACEYESDINAIKKVLGYNTIFPFVKKYRILRKDKDGKTCFDYAKKNSGSEEILELLSKYASDPSEVKKLAEAPTSIETSAETNISDEQIQDVSDEEISDTQSYSENEKAEELTQRNEELTQNTDSLIQEEEPAVVASAKNNDAGIIENAKPVVQQSVVPEVSVVQESKTITAAENVALSAGTTAVEMTAAVAVAESAAIHEMNSSKKEREFNIEVSNASNTFVEEKKEPESIYLYDYAPDERISNVISGDALNSSVVRHEFISDVNKTFDNGRTKLMVAAKNGDLALIENLIYSGAQIEAKDNDGWTALMYASRFQTNVDVIKTLLLYGASVNAKNNYGITPLLLASGFSSNPDIVSVLLENFTPNSEAARSAFIYAISNYNGTNVLNVFFNKKVPINVPYEGKTALMYACETNKDTRIISWLLSKGASKYQRDSVTGKTAFDFARENSRLKHDKVYWSLDPKQE